MSEYYIARSEVITKGELAKRMELDARFKGWDYALPQAWLDDFWHSHGFNYDLILSTTFWVYDGIFGYPLSGDKQVNEAIKKENQQP